MRMRQGCARSQTGVIVRRNGWQGGVSPRDTKVVSAAAWFVCLLCSGVASAQITLPGAGDIATVAGRGTFTGDNGAATSAQLSFPFGVALDSAGNLYIADNNNNRIREVTASSGIIVTLAGNGDCG